MKQTAKVFLTLTNSVIGDGLLSSEVSQTLREYANMIDSGVAGNEPHEIYIGSNGSELSIISVTTSEVRIPRSKPEKSPAVFAPTAL